MEHSNQKAFLETVCSRLLENLEVQSILDLSSQSKQQAVQDAAAALSISQSIMAGISATHQQELQAAVQREREWAGSIIGYYTELPVKPLQQLDAEQQHSMMCLTSLLQQRQLPGVALEKNVNTVFKAILQHCTTGADLAAKACQIDSFLQQVAPQCCGPAHIVWLAAVQLLGELRQLTQLNGTAAYLQLCGQVLAAATPQNLQMRLMYVKERLHAVLAAAAAAAAATAAPSEMVAPGLTAAAPMAAPMPAPAAAAAPAAFHSCSMASEASSTTAAAATAQGSMAPEASSPTATAAPAQKGSVAAGASSTTAPAATAQGSMAPEASSTTALAAMAQDSTAAAGSASSSMPAGPSCSRVQRCQAGIAGSDAVQRSLLQLSSSSCIGVQHSLSGVPRSLSELHNSSGYSSSAVQRSLQLVQRGYTMVASSVAVQCSLPGVQRTSAMQHSLPLVQHCQAVVVSGSAVQRSLLELCSSNNNSSDSSSSSMKGCSNAEGGSSVTPPAQQQSLLEQDGPATPEVASAAASCSSSPRTSCAESGDGGSSSSSSKYAGLPAAGSKQGRLLGHVGGMSRRVAGCVAWPLRALRRMGK